MGYPGPLPSARSFMEHPDLQQAFSTTSPSVYASCTYTTGPVLYCSMSLSKSFLWDCKLLLPHWMVEFLTWSFP